MTIRPTLYALAALMLLILVTGAFWAGGRDNAAREANETIETRERIDDALDNPTGCAWADRLRGTCE